MTAFDLPAAGLLGDARHAHHHEQEERLAKRLGERLKELDRPEPNPDPQPLGAVGLLARPHLGMPVRRRNAGLEELADHRR